MNQPSRDLLDEKELLGEPIKPTNMGKRLANLVIDTFFFYCLVLTIGFIVAMINPALIDVIEQPHPIVDQLVGSLLFAGYYLVFENWLGKSPGKILTRTKVVTTDGARPPLNQLIWRNISRMIPFDFITFIRKTPIGLHDRLSQTMVIDDRPRVSFDRSLADDEPLQSSSLPQ